MAAELLILRSNTRALLNEGLYDSAEIIGSVLMRRVAVAPPESQIEELHAEALELYADALLGKGEHNRAMAFVKQALTQRKLGPRRPRSRSGTPRHSPDNSSQSMEMSRRGEVGQNSATAGLRVNVATPAADSSPINVPGVTAASSGAWQRGYMQEAALRFKEAKCLLKSGDTSAAITALEGVLLFARTAEMNICLAQVYENVGLKRNAATTYKVALRQKALALEVVPPLLLLSGGADKVEVWDIIRGGLPALPGAPSVDDLPWLEFFLEGHACASANKYKEALESFVDMERWCPNDIHALLQIGKAYFNLGMHEEALQTFAKARLADEHCVDLMDYYALAITSRYIAVAPSFQDASALNRLAHDLLAIDCHRPEAWLAAALLCRQRSDPEAGLTLLDKALELRPRYALALCVRGSILLLLERPEHAQMAFRQASGICRDIHSFRGLCKAASACRRSSEAISIAREAFTAMPDSAQAAVLLGDALLRAAEASGGDVTEAKNAFKRAFIMDPKCTDAAIQLADCYIAAREYKECIDMLLNMTWTTPSDALHRKLAEVYHRDGQLSEALTYFHMAISLNPSNAEATQGLEQLEKQMRGIDTSVVADGMES